jgi:hypothetical protein
MNNLVKATLSKTNTTANGMTTHSTSLNKCLDLFFIAGASRNMSETDITKMFIAAVAENNNIALKILFWARDVRGGAGERRFFRICMLALSENYPDLCAKVTEHIPEYGRWDDIFYGDTNEAITSIMWALGSANALCAKWMPRKGPVAEEIRKAMGMTPKEYRKTLVALTNVVESKMCKKQWNKIEFSKIPSIAFSRYRNAFWRNDGSRFAEFLTDVKEGKQKINAGAIFPHDIIRPYLDMRCQKDDAITEQWNALPNYMEGSKENILPVCDVSGSMQGLPMEVSISLGIYISERNEGTFKDAFITFSSQPTMEYLQGDVWERARQLSMANWCMSTDLEATFDLVLDSAVRDNVPQSQMPTKLLIISDMEFNQATGGGYWDSNNSDWNPTAMEMVKEKYKNAGYEMPGIVFWNVNGRMGNVPTKADTENTALVSGFSPAILTSVLGGELPTPLEVMFQTLNNERYKRIKA